MWGGGGECSASSHPDDVYDAVKAADGHEKLRMRLRVREGLEGGSNRKGRVGARQGVGIGRSWALAFL